MDLGIAVEVLNTGRLLLVKREDSEVWCLPGGAVDDGESIAEAAVREVIEESGLTVRLERLVGIYSRPSWSSHQVIFRAGTLGGTPRLQDGETTAVDFFDVHMLPPLVPWHRQPIDDAIRDVGGSAAWKLDWMWPFPRGATRQEIYELRDRSGLSRFDFYRLHFCQLGPAGEQREVQTASRAVLALSGQKEGIGCPTSSSCSCINPGLISTAPSTG